MPAVPAEAGQEVLPGARQTNEGARLVWFFSELQFAGSLCAQESTALSQPLQVGAVPAPPPPDEVLKNQFGRGRSTIRFQKKIHIVGDTYSDGRELSKRSLPVLIKMNKERSDSGHVTTPAYHQGP
jgi:hypothetical protein